MLTKIIGKNITITPAMEEHVQKKLRILDKYLLIPEDTEARVLARTYKKGSGLQKAEITIPTKLGILRAEASNSDFYAAVNIAIDKLEDQIRRQKTKIKKKNQGMMRKDLIDAEDDEEKTVLKTKQISTDVMSADDAALQMELLGHSFFVYKDENTSKISVIYARHDGYGCLEVQE